ncbi:hypothetical protein BH11MYX1_BH11MYX1_05590 [soil metagenome]
MKKCASCTKDLPDAALHCVFCGAKQPPTPAVQGGLAKTAFGYSNEMMEHLKSSQPGVPTQPPRTQAPPQPPVQAPRPQSPSPQPLAPTAAANAATVFITGGPPPPAAPHAGAYNIGPPPPANQAAFMQTAVAAPEPQYRPSQPLPQLQPPGQPAQQSGMGIMGPPGSFAQPAPPPYQRGQSGQRAGQASPAGRPVEPWRRALPLLMIIWGAATLVAFAAPVSIDPLHFAWQGLMEAPGSLKIIALLPPAIGLLGLVLGLIPMAVLPRGLLATLIGAAGVVVPVVILGALPDWHLLAPVIGVTLIVPGLVVRSRYVDSLFARLLVSIGVIAVLLPFVLPEHGEIPLIMMFKALIDGHMHGQQILIVAMVVFVLLHFIVWLPGPSTAGSALFAWVWMLAPLIIFGFTVSEHLDQLAELAKANPAALIAWVPVSTCIIFIGYGLASVFGKQLE